MADIELVIKIPEEHFKKICANKEDAIIAHDTCRRIANGMPLPKGHGRLIDADHFKDVALLHSWHGNNKNKHVSIYTYYIVWRRRCSF